MTKIFENVKPGDLITSDLFNKMADKIEELDDRLSKIERTSSGTISGAVTQIEQNVSMPVIGARIYAVSANVTYSSAPTDKLGNYSITDLLPGKYRVWAESEGFAISMMETVSVSPAATNTVNFVLTSTVNKVIVPDVQGMVLSRALTEIVNSGLAPGLLMDVDSNIIDGTDPASASLIVINQSLAPGEPIPVGKELNLFMAGHAAVPSTPSIIDIKPNVGQTGDAVQIIGKAFGAQKGRVTFSGVSAVDITEWIGDSIKLKVPDGVVKGSIEVKVTTAEGVTSNGYSFSTGGPCTGGCIASCTSCTNQCTNGLIINDCFSKIICSVKETINTPCTRDLSPDIEKFSFESACASRIVNLQNPGNIYEYTGETLINNPDIAIKKSDIITIDDRDSRFEGTIKKADVKIEGKEGEISKAIITSGTKNVEIQTQSGDEVKGNAISSTAIGVASKATVISIKDAKGKAWGGTIVTAEGQYEAGAGITIEPGKGATIQVGDKLITGKVSERTVINTKDLDLGKVGINRLSP